MSRSSKDSRLDMSGLTEEERVDLSAQIHALAIKVGPVKARAWGRSRVDEINQRNDQEETTP